MATIVKAIIVYWLLLFVIRIVGRRAVNKMTPFELILLFIVGGMAIQAVVTNDRSLTNAFLAIATVGMMHVLVASLKHRSPKSARLVDGTPIVIVEGGHWHEDRMNHLRLQKQDVAAAARSRGIRLLDDVDYAIVEGDGTISIIRKRD